MPQVAPVEFSSADHYTKADFCFPARTALGLFTTSELGPLPVLMDHSSLAISIYLTTDISFGTYA